MIKIFGLIAMAIVLMSLCYEIGYCNGYGLRDENECEKFVKGNENEEKSD